MMDMNDIVAACGTGVFVTIVCLGILAAWNMFYTAMNNFWWSLWK